MASGPAIDAFAEAYILGINTIDMPSILEVSKKLSKALEDQKELQHSAALRLLVMRLMKNGMDLVHYESRDLRQKIFGLCILDCILDDLDTEKKKEIPQLCKQLMENSKIYLETDSLSILIRLAASCVGHYAKLSTTEAEYMKTAFMEPAFIWVGDQRSETRRYSAILLLTQLTVHQPSIIYEQRHKLFSGVFETISDRSKAVRLSAAEALTEALKLVAQRESTVENIGQALHHIHININTSVNERVIGSFLILEILLSGAVMTSTEFQSAFKSSTIVGSEELIKGVLDKKDHPDSEIKTKVIELIPKLAFVFSADFKQGIRTLNNSLTYLVYSIEHLLASVPTVEYRKVAYISIGKLFQAMSITFKASTAKISEIMGAIKRGFDSPFCIEALQCLGMVLAVSEVSRDYLDREMLRAMFNGGFTSDLAECLKIVLIHKPAERRSIQYDLILPHFDILAAETDQKRAAEEEKVGGASGVKSQSFYADVASKTLALVTNQNPKKWFRTSIFGESAAFVPQFVSSVSVSFESQIILGLRMLASSDFFPKMSRQDSERNREGIERNREESSLLEIIRNSVMRYLDHENPDIRRAVVVTTISMLDKVILSVASKSSDWSLVGTIIDRILVHGIGDDDPTIRASVFESLMPSLDTIVSRSRNVNCVIEALNDDFITVRCASMSLLARISSFNKIHLLPIIRLLLSKLMRQLQMSADKQLHQESVLLVQAIVKGSTTQMLPYVDNIFKAMLKLLDDEGESSDPRSQAVVAASLATIGELVVSSPELITSNQDKVFKMIVSALEDTSNAAKKQEMAVITLGKIVRSSDMKVLPYARYPGLFESIVDIIQRVDDLPLRLQAVKTAGLLGVAEQNIFEAYLFNVEIIDKDRDGEDVLDIFGNLDDENEDEEMKLDKLYLSVIIKSLTKIISDDNLHKFHQDAAQVIVEIIKTLKKHIMEDRVCMGDIIRSFHDRIKKSDLNPAVRKILIEQLTTIVHVLGKYLGEYRGEYLTDIIDVAQEFFFSDQHDCLNLIESLCLEVKKQDEVDLILSNIVPCMIRTIKEEPITFLEDIQSRRASVGTKPSLPKSEDVFKVVANISSRLGQYRVQFLPPIVQIMCRKDIALESRRRALCTVVHIALDSNESAIGVVHPILRLLSDQAEPDLHFPVVAGLLSLAVKLGDLFKPFIVPIKRKLEQIKKKDVLLKKEYQDLMARLLSIYNSVIDQICKGEAIDSTQIEFSFDKMFPRDLKRYKDLKISSKPEKMSLEVKKGDLGLAWTLTGRMTASDLSQWMDRLSKELLQQSPSSILRLCSDIAQKSRSLANELFNISFSAIWDHLLLTDASDLNNLVLNLELALRSPQIPVSITHTILNLAEFMEILDKSFPLDIELLARDAEKVEMYSKCLYFREIEFSSMHLTSTQVEECIASLIIVNNKLGLLDSASGILKCVENRYRDSFEVKPYWLEMLTRWELAGQAYENKLEKLDPWKGKGWMECELGSFRCLHALGAYEDLLKRAEELKQKMEINSEEVENYHYWIDEIEKLGASAAWSLNEWGLMERFMSTDTGVSSSATAVDVNLEQNKSFFQAISAIHRKEYPNALKIIDSTRKSIASNIGILLGENYSRANKAMVSMQVLAEMEEAIEYNIEKDNLERAISKISDVDDEDMEGPLEDHAIPVDKKKIDISVKKNSLRQKLLKTWNMRFVNLPKDIDTYRLVLSVHSLVVEDPKDNLYHWLKLASMCRKEGRLLLCESILLRLAGPTGKPIVEDILRIPRLGDLEESAIVKLDTSSFPLYILYDACKLLWTKDKREEALQELRGIVDYIDEFQKKSIDKSETGTVIKVKALLKRAEWMKALRQPPEEVFEVVKIAKDTTLKTGNYWIWHAWATVNFEKVQAAVVIKGLDPKKRWEVKEYLNSAIDGFLKSVQYGDEDRQPLANILPDVLRLITLVFNSAPKLCFHSAQSLELKKISSKYWLEVIPQLIARMDNDPYKVLRFILEKLANEHPQALVCPILLAEATVLDDETSSKSGKGREQLSMCRAILEKVYSTEDGETLIHEAKTMSQQLKKVAMTPQESWLEGLERAKKIYGDIQKGYGEKRPSPYLELIKELEQLHASIGDTIKHESLRDISFIHCFGRDISDAYRWLIIFKRSQNLFDLRQAWEIYLKLNRRLRDQIKCMEKLELGHISQYLAKYRFSKLAVPGTYRDQKVIKILQFIGTVDVFQSKQRPRKISILGSDEKIYRFLLKINEDLRQDERVMQLFRLINVCLENDRNTRKHRLAITSYSVLPLSNNSALIGWVDDCDTLSKLIAQYRKTKNVNLNVEEETLFKYILLDGKEWKEEASKKFAKYDRLPFLGKVEIFRQVLDNTTGNDLARMLWLKSKTSDVWVERRANFTKSTAVMSVVGYLLGLGDRHLANIMLERKSGKIVHIDFGDCFESTMHRAQYPERVPFRLTRMMTNAMEASGIEGTFRSTCEKVMSVLRGNGDSLQAMLEAFLHDPLVNWKGKETVVYTEPAADEDGAVPDENETSDEQQEKVKPEDAPRVRNDVSINSRALEVVERIQLKLTGGEFLNYLDREIDHQKSNLTVQKQVDKLITLATSAENLCLHYYGWKPFW